MSVESKRKTVRRYKALWDAGMRTAHSFTFSGGVTFGMLRKFGNSKICPQCPETTVDSFNSHCIIKVFSFHNIKLWAFCILFCIFGRTVVGPVLSYILWDCSEILIFWIIRAEKKISLYKNNFE